MALAEQGVDGRPLPRAAYLVGLASVEGPERRVFMDPIEQRRRFVGALQELIVERGFPGPNVQDIADRAEISRYAFVRHFTDVDDCFRAALGQAEDDLRKFVGRDLRRVRGFEARLDVAVGSMLEFASREPTPTRLVVFDSFSEQAVASPGYGEEFATLRAWLAAQVGIDGPGAPGSVQQEVNADAVQTLLGSRLRSIADAACADLAREVGYFLLSAFAGPGGLGDWFGNGESELEVV